MKPDESRGADTTLSSEISDIGSDKENPKHKKGKVKKGEDQIMKMKV